MQRLNAARAPATRRWRFGVSLAAAVLLGTAARAAPPAPDARHDVGRAKVELALGQRHYDEARYQQALAAFQAAYAAYPAADFHYDIALCHERLGDLEAAITAFEAYVAAIDDDGERAVVERRIGVLRSRLPATVPAARPTAVPRSRASPTDGLIDPFPGGRVSPPVDLPRRDGRSMIVGGAVALSLGLAIGIGGGLGFGLPAARTGGRAGDRLLAAQLASVGVGAVLLATGVGLVIVGRRRQRAARAVASLGASASGVVLVGRF